jgi:hypothetical protein
MYVIESAYFDWVGMFNIQTNGIKDATLFASVSIFAIGAARFAETWGGYVKGVNTKKKMVAQAGAIQVPLDE